MDAFNFLANWGHTVAKYFWHALRALALLCPVKGYLCICGWLSWLLLQPMTTLGIAKTAGCSMGEIVVLDTEQSIKLLELQCSDFLVKLKSSTLYVWDVVRLLILAECSPLFSGLYSKLKLQGCLILPLRYSWLHDSTSNKEKKFCF